MNNALLVLVASVVLSASWSPCDAQVPGPRKRVAVLPFELRPSVANYEVGYGLTEMVTTALVNTGKFVVLERTRLDDVLQEQNLALDGRVAPSSQVEAARVLGAQLLLTGSITEFTQNASRTGISIPLGPIAGGLSTSKGKIAIDIRLI